MKDEDIFVGKILCAWCGEPIDEKGVELYASGGYEDSFGSSSSEADASLEIVCMNEKCPKYTQPIYKKEYKARNW